MLDHFVVSNKKGKGTLSSVIVIYVCVISDCVLTRAQWWFYNTERGEIFCGGRFVWSLLVESKISEIWSRTVITQKLWGRIYSFEMFFFFGEYIDENRFRSHATMWKDFLDFKDTLKYDSRVLSEAYPKSEICHVKILMPSFYRCFRYYINT